MKGSLISHQRILNGIAHQGLQNDFLFDYMGLKQLQDRYFLKINTDFISGDPNLQSGNSDVKGLDRTRKYPESEK